MSRSWLTARPGFSEDMRNYRRNVLRRAYRQLRRRGFDRHAARRIVLDIAYAAQLPQVKP